MAKAIRINLEVPAGVSGEARESAEDEAREAAVLALWRQQQLTIREAAEELGLTYREFLDLLAERGIPVESEPLDLEALADARRKIAGGQA
jgi:predicted HTH domain antitoxin